MKKKQIIGLVIAAVLFIAVGVSSVLTNTFSQKMLNDSVEHILTGDYRFNAPLSDYIAIVRVEGTIQEQTQTGIFDSPEGYQHLTTMDTWYQWQATRSMQIPIPLPAPSA